MPTDPNKFGWQNLHPSLDLKIQVLAKRIEHLEIVQDALYKQVNAKPRRGRPPGAKNKERPAPEK
jgi:hypothetical protein